MKNQLVTVLRELGDEVVDLGTHDMSSVDYPKYGQLVGQAVATDGGGALGLGGCGSGIGISIAANKVHGIRCALVHDTYTAEMARKHNDCNVIAIGARVVGQGVAEAAV